MKFPHISTLGADNGWYRVGPLARVQIADFLPSPQAEEERKTFRAAGGGKPVARRAALPLGALIEMLHAAELAARSVSTIPTSSART